MDLVVDLLAEMLYLGNKMYFEILFSNIVLFDLLLGSTMLSTCVIFVALFSAHVYDNFEQKLAKQ